VPRKTDDRRLKTDVEDGVFEEGKKEKSKILFSVFKFCFLLSVIGLQKLKLVAFMDYSFYTRFY